MKATRSYLAITAFGMLAFAVSACGDATGPANDGLIGCHVLSTSPLTNGSPAATATLRFTPDSVERLQSSSGTPTSGLNRGTWLLEDDQTLKMWFGGGFVGMTYTFSTRFDGRWFGKVHFWVDTPVLDGEGTAVLSAVRCP
jgi:hypothetical protein